jgi:uncharacterized protein YdhG (YjbR/CyaY superfamily)
MDTLVAKYMAKQEPRQREVLTKIRELIVKLIPKAEEKMSYGAPGFKLDGKTVLYAGFKNHIGLYPEPAAMEKFKEMLEGYETAKGTIKFKIDEPIPYNLIREIIIDKYGL